MEKFLQPDVSGGLSVCGKTFQAPYSSFQSLFLLLFLVGAFFLKERSPTITLSSFFSVDNLTEWSTFYNLFSFDQFSSTKPESVGSILALNHKFFYAPKSTGETKVCPLWVFSALCYFRQKFSNFIKGYPLAFC